MEASWVVHSQGLLVLKVAPPLTWYLGYYGWNGQRRSSAAPMEDRRKMRMWAAVGQYRNVRIELIQFALYCSTSRLVEVAFSLCHSWSQADSPPGQPDTRRKADVELGGFFKEPLPFNVDPDDKSEDELSFAYDLAAYSGQNLLLLVRSIAKHRGQSDWKIVADTQLGEEMEGGRERLRALQAECDEYGVVLEGGSSELAGGG